MDSWDGIPFTLPLLVLVGPTAIGKTSLSLELAERFNAEIISVDSVQVYRFMDIGSAKATAEERQRVKHHLIDIVDPDQDYDAGRFAKDAKEAIKKINAKGKLPLLTGGTGLYFRSLFTGISPGLETDLEVRRNLHQRVATEGLNSLHEELTLIDPISAEKIHKNDVQRVLRGLEIFELTGKPWSEHLREQNIAKEQQSFRNILQLGLTCPRQQLYERINLRCHTMINSGLEDEVTSLAKRGYGADLKSMQTIGYRHMHAYLKGIWTKSEMREFLARDTRHYAKRQYTWV